MHDTVNFYHKKILEIYKEKFGGKVRNINLFNLAQDPFKVYEFAPTEKRPTYIVATVGMSNCKIDADSCPHSEYILEFNRDWQFQQVDFNGSPEGIITPKFDSLAPQVFLPLMFRLAIEKGYIPTPWQTCDITSFIRQEPHTRGFTDILFVRAQGDDGSEIEPVYIDGLEVDFLQIVPLYEEEKEAYLDPDSSDFDELFCHETKLVSIDRPSFYKMNRLLFSPTFVASNQTEFDEEVATRIYSGFSFAFMLAMREIGLIDGESLGAKELENESELSDKLTKWIAETKGDIWSSNLYPIAVRVAKELITKDEYQLLSSYLNIVRQEDNECKTIEKIKDEVIKATFKYLNSFFTGLKYNVVGSSPEVFVAKSSTIKAGRLPELVANLGRQQTDINVSVAISGSELEGKNSNAKFLSLEVANALFVLCEAGSDCGETQEEKGVYVKDNGLGYKKINCKMTVRGNCVVKLGAKK